ncbi:MAG: U32 family peptidase [Planctomycetes bacterium]|nr:U32 family peptidase [Planctomycetota bacterium]MCP4771852.1 U32 family peptidase [Planctomycetota bacterium]MCP4861973.1 U32 family peptidase [Planctomycetota bacterium]
MEADVPAKIELLAPAGCYPSLRAAISNGADAVYFGLAQLNMRARSRRSFEREDLAEICRICRESNVKSYLALNTVLYQHDLKLCKSLLEEAAEQQVSAVILSDMAAVMIAEDLGLEVHLSTQLSISNADAVRFYASHCDRIVLARELSLPMIKSVHQQIVEQDIRGVSGRLMELEAFAHGALCIAVSGRCSMSLYSSNASANRGACDQNCRKEYIVKDAETGHEMLVDNNYVMSPTDILTIGFVDQMVEAGVQVFKIEGRGRAPEYVGAVTAAYRKALDAVQDGSFNEELANELIPELEKVYNRGFSSGYYLGQEQGWAKVGGSKATRQKQMIGTITNVFQKAGVIEVEASAGKLSVEDEYVVIGHTTGAVNGTVLELRMEDEAGNASNPQEVSKGDRFTLPHVGDARRGDQLYRLAPIEQPTSV